MNVPVHSNLPIFYTQQNILKTKAMLGRNLTHQINLHKLIVF